MLGGNSHFWNAPKGVHGHADQKVSRLQLLKLIVIGIGRFIGGVTQFWNHGLVMGKYPYLISTIWYGVACICLAFSLAELVSALPFTGGLYGYVRGLMGPYYGFICAVFEVYCNIAAISLYLMGFGKACVTALDLPDVYQLLFFIIPFAVCASLHFSGKKIFWRGSLIITMIAILMVFMYAAASIYNINWNPYHANYDAHQESAISKTQKVVNWQGGPSLFFAGEYLVPALVANEERHSISATPITIVWTTFSILVIAVTIVYLSTLQYPGATALKEAHLPLNYAFSSAFNISYNQAAWLNIPISLASFVIAMYYLIAILKAMASSGLLPGRLLRTMGDAETPYEAIRVTYMGAVLITLIYIASSVAGRFYSLTLYTLSTFYLYSLWIGLMIAYLLFRKRFSALKRNFRSPLGIYGAYVAIFSAVQHFLTQFYPIHGYSFAPFIVFVLSMIALTYVYARWIIKYQKYSEEEERVFFVTYVVSANRRLQERRTRKRAIKRTQSNANQSIPDARNGLLFAHSSSSSSNSHWTQMLFQGDKTLYELLREILSPSNVAHRDLLSGDEENDLDANALDGRHPQKVNTFLLKNSALSRIIPTIEVDHSLDIHLDGTLAVHSSKNSEMKTVKIECSCDSVVEFATFEPGNNNNDKHSAKKPSHLYNRHDDRDSDDQMLPMPSSTMIVDGMQSQFSHNHSIDNYDRLALSDIPDDEA